MKKLAIIILSFVLLYSYVKAQVNVNDSLALVALYNSTNGPNWTDNTGWLQDSVANWYGITVSEGRVTEIFLTSNNLTDSIPQDIGNLVQLNWLFLSNNNLSYNIPQEIGNLVNLTYLILLNNNLTGNIPQEISNLDNLEYLNFSFNNLSGNIPPEIGDLNSLTHIDLQYNNLSDSIPQEIGNLNNLTSLLLFNNNLSGNIPQEISDIVSLSKFYINNNYYTLSNIKDFDSDSIETFVYSPQKLKLNKSIEYKNSGDSLQLNITELATPAIDTTNNQYQWLHNGYSITSYSSSPELNLTDIDNSHEGYYYCKIINPDLPLLVVNSDSILVIIDNLDITITPDSIDENVSSDSFVGTINIILTNYSLAFVDGDGENDIDNSNFTLINDSLFINISPDYEVKREYYIYIQAADTASNTFNSEQIIYVNNLNDNNPVLDDQIFTIDENSSDGTTVDTVIATDADDDLNTLSYSIISGNTNDVFAIDSLTGEITVNNSSELDYETTQQYILTIEVSDGTFTDNASVTININDLVETGMQEISPNSWDIRPNPTSGEFYVTVDETIDYSNMIIEVINSSGQVIYHTIMSSPEQFLNISGYSKGFYSVRIRGENIQWTKSIILQ